MELVFIHGWGFDARFWDALASLLPQYKQRRIDLGFFGPAFDAVSEEPSVLIGHSLGFVHGLRQHKDWAGWVAINSFPRFVETPEQIGCVPAAMLRDMRMRLANDTAQTLDNFYKLTGTELSAAAQAQPDANRLRDGLDDLRDGDAGKIVAALDRPGLVLASRNDPLVPEPASQSLMTQAAGAVELSWHDSGGHLLPQNDPAWCAAKIRGFLKNL